jgi:hypothetical protein
LIDPWVLGSKDERDVQGYAATPVNMNNYMFDFAVDVGAAGVDVLALIRQQLAARQAEENQTQQNAPATGAASPSAAAPAATPPAAARNLARETRDSRGGSGAIWPASSGPGWSSDTRGLLSRCRYQPQAPATAAEASAASLETCASFQEMRNAVNGRARLRGG